MRRSVYLPCCLLLACAWPIDMHSQAQTDLTIVHLAPGTRLTSFEQTILDREKETCDRAIRRDFTGWEALLSNNALAVYSNGYATKAEVLEAIKTMIGGHCIMDKVKFTAINKKAGLITYRMTQDWEEGGKAQSRQYYISSLWMNRGGRWTTSFWQETNTTTQNTAIPPGNADLPPDSFFIAKEKEDWEALKNKDKAAAARLLADDFVGMYDTGYSTKSEWMKQIDGRYTLDDYSIEDVKLLHPSPTMALLLYKAICKGTGEWSEFCSRPEYVSDLFVERNGQWLALFSQDTPSNNNQSEDSASVKSRDQPGVAKTHTEEPTKVAGETERMIVGLEEQILQAAVNSDVKITAALLAPDFQDVGEYGIWDKAKSLSETANPPSPQSLSMNEVHFSQLAPTAFLLTYKLNEVDIDQGKPVPSTKYVSSLWVNRGGKWLNVLSQDTPATSPTTRK